MELTTARLTLLVDPNKQAAFERSCAQQDLPQSQLPRQLIRSEFVHRGVLTSGPGRAARGAGTRNA